AEEQDDGPPVHLPVVEAAESRGLRRELNDSTHARAERALDRCVDEEGAPPIAPCACQRVHDTRARADTDTSMNRSPIRCSSIGRRAVPARLIKARPS